MDQDIQATYLETQVMTATPQRLRLMLIEGAMRFAREAIMHHEQADADATFESILRCRAIITELLGAIKSDRSEAARQVAGIYLFLFRELSEIQMKHDAARLGEVVRVLEVEQETWRQLCEAMPEAPEPEESSLPKEITAGSAKAIPPAPMNPTTYSAGFDSSAIPPMPSGGFDSNAPSSLGNSSGSSGQGGFSFEG